MAVNETSVRIPSLDGLRAISIALVIAGHFFHVLGIGGSGNLGNLGVRVFFVISGFLITGLLVREIERTSTIDLLKFYYRRSMRIFPPFYFYVLVIFVADHLGFIRIPAGSISFSAVYLTDYVNPDHWHLGHTWSLAVEEQFYLILPGVLLFAATRRVRLLLIFLVLLVPALRIIDFRISGDAHWVLKGFHANMDALAVGCLLTLVRNALHENYYYSKFLRSNYAFFLVPLIMLFNVQTAHPHLFYGISMTVMNISIGLMLDWLVSNQTSRAGRFLNTRPMVTVGMMSYSIYLWQQPFFDPKETSLITQFPVNFIGLAATTLFSYYAIERTSLWLRQKWEPKLFSRSEAVSTGAKRRSPIKAT